MSTVNPFNITAVYIQQRDKTGEKKGPRIYILAENSGFGPHGSDQSGLELGLLKSVVIKESMLDSTMSGSMTFIDRAKLTEKLKLSPLDLINIDLFEENSEISKSLVFSITAVTQDKDDIPSSISGTDNVGRYVTLEFTSNELYLLNYSEFDYVENDFIGPISGNNGLVQYLSSNILKKKSKAFSTNIADIKADETFNWIWLKKNPIFYPWGKPDLPSRLFPLLKLLAENAVDKKNPNAANFMFWQDMDNWNFRSIESIITEYENKGDLKTYSYTIETDKADGIITLESSVDSAPETDFFNLVDGGAFASNYIFVEPKYDQDPYARYLDTSGALERKEIKYNYIKDLKKWKSIEKIPILSENEYIEKWDHNRIFDEKYGYFSPNFYNREKSVKWEYYGYTLANRNERTLWQTPFDITDMNGEILRKIQKQIKEPLAKKRLEYAKKMNLKEKWKVYKCAICCAGVGVDDDLGTTLTNTLSTYEIVSAGSFTDVFNYLPSEVTGPTGSSFLKSGLTLSYNLEESPYNLSIGQFLNLEMSPDNFIKYRFDLEIARHEKMLSMIDKNSLARKNRVEQIDIASSFFQLKTFEKEIDCSDSECRSNTCPCPTRMIIDNGADGFSENSNVKQFHKDQIPDYPGQSIIIQIGIDNFKQSIRNTIEKLRSLKAEFIALYDSYWSRKAFFFSKDLDYSFMKSENNLLNVKSIKRLPIKGSKYEPFATRKSLSGFTFADGSTAFYPYSVPKNICNEELSDSVGSTANPYFDRKYSSDPKADFWISFKNPYSRFSYTDRDFSDVPKGPIWYRNMKVTFKARRGTRHCPANAALFSGPRICTKGCQGAVNQRCSRNVEPYNQEEQDTVCAADFGVQGEDWVYGKCSEYENREFVEQIYNDIIYCSEGTDFGSECLLPLGYMTTDCCSSYGNTPVPGGDDEQGIIFGEVWNSQQEYCNYLQSVGCTGSLAFEIGCSDIQNAPTAPDLDEPFNPSSCSWDDFNTDLSSETGVILEVFSNDKNILSGPTNVVRNTLARLSEKSKDENSSSTDVNIVFNASMSTVDEWVSDVKLLHPWGADELGENGEFTEEDYNNYKKAASLFDDDLQEKIPPSLYLEGLESYVRIEFKSPIGLETLEDFPDGFVNTPGSEYFLPYIVLLTAGPFGAEAARTNVSVIGQDPYGFDVAVKKTKNKDDFAKMNLHDYGSGVSMGSLQCAPYSTAASWLRRSQDAMFYRPNPTGSELYTPSGIQDIFCASSLQRSAPVKSWWDLWVSLPPVAIATYHNRLDLPNNLLGKFGFFDTENFNDSDYAANIGKDAVIYSSGDFGSTDWPFYIKANNENIVAGLYPANIIITRINNNEKLKNKLGKNPEILDGIIPTGLRPNLNSIEPSPPFVGLSANPNSTTRYVKSYPNARTNAEKLDPEQYTFLEVDYPHINEVDPNKNYPLMSYAVGTVIYGGAGFTAGQVWKFDISRKTEYGIVQLSSDSMPSMLSLVGGIGGNIEAAQKYYEWWSSKLVDWYQNTIFDNNFSAQFVVFSKQSTPCDEYPCANPSGFVNNSDCPDDDPLCKCPCQELRPDKITKVKDRFTGAMVPASTADFGPEPTTMELKKLKEETNECNLIKNVLGEEWLGCVWDDPESPYNCKCPCIGNKFYEYMKYNQIYSTFWDTPLQTPLFRNAQMSLLMANRIMIGVPGDLSVKPGQIIELDTPSTDSTGGQKRFGGKWLIYAIDHIMISGSHAMRLFLCRDSNNKVATK